MNYDDIPQLGPEDDAVSYSEKVTRVLKSKGADIINTDRPQLKPEHDFTLFFERLDKEREKGRPWKAMIGEIVLGVVACLIIFWGIAWLCQRPELKDSAIAMMEHIASYGHFRPVQFAIACIEFIASFIAFMYAVVFVICFPILLVIGNVVDILHRLITGKKRSLFA